MRSQKPVIADLVTADEQDGCSPRIESVEYPVRLATTLHAQFSHVRVAPTLNARRMREWQLRTFGFKKADRTVDVILNPFNLGSEPISELVRVFHVPSHVTSYTCHRWNNQEYSAEGISSMWR